MKTITIAKPKPTSLSQSLHLAEIDGADHSKGEVEVRLAVKEGDCVYEHTLRYEEPIEEDSPLLRLIAAAEAREMRLEELEGFDLDRLSKKHVVIGTYNRKASGGRLVPTVALMFSLEEIKRFAARLEPAQSPTQPPTTT